jgi:uncharacterized protein (UPF0333 family)
MQTIKKQGVAYRLLILAVVLSVCIAIWFVSKYNGNSSTQSTNDPKTSEYNPQIDPNDFTTKVTNKYFSLEPGKKLVYEGMTPDGVERIEITVEKETKNIAGVDTLIYRDTVHLDGELVEDTRDYLAQEKATGDVWYFGEDTINYENGKFKDNEGSFLHGTDGAKAGIWLKAEQKPGDSYRQEYYKGIAEDMLDVVAVNQTVKTKRATYSGCVKLYAWTPLESESRENKYNCPNVGEVLIIDLANNTRIELISLVKP